MERYKELLERYNKCADPRKRQRLWNILNDMQELHKEKNGTMVFELLPPRWFISPKLKFKRKSPIPLKWIKGYINPNGKLRLTRKILEVWRPKSKRVFFAVQNDEAIILSKKKAIKVPEENLRLFVSRIYKSKISKGCNNKLNKQIQKIKINNSESIIDFIPAIGKCRGEPKRLKKCWRV